MNKVGRPLGKTVPLNWRKVERLLAKGKTAATIAAALGISRDTLQYRCRTHLNHGFKQLRLKVRRAQQEQIKQLKNDKKNINSL